jgi:outer membrane protein assembly factor BamB
MPAKYFPLLLLCFIFSIYRTNAQTDSAQTETIVRKNFNYRRIAVSQGRIFAISDSGDVVIWDMSRMDTLSYIPRTKKYTYRTVGKDRNGLIYIGTSRGEIFKIDPQTLKISIAHKLKYSIRDFYFTSDNRMFVAVPYALYDVQKRKYWTEFENHASGIYRQRRVLGLYTKKIKRYFDPPDYSFVDSKDRIWMLASFGEFGGEVQVFDARNLKIFNNNFQGIDNGLFFPRSAFEDTSGNIYITSGLQHMSNDGEIYRIAPDSKVTKVFNIENYKDTCIDRTYYPDGSFLEKPYNGFFIGPGTYNRFDHNIYFATQLGIYKAPVPKGDRMTLPVKVFDPTLMWDGARLAVGYEMAVKYMEFISPDRMIFLISSDGIGLYEKGKLTFFK